MVQLLSRLKEKLFRFISIGERNRNQSYDILAQKWKVILNRKGEKRMKESDSNRYHKTGVVTLTFAVNDLIHEMMEEGRIETYTSTINDGKGFIVLKTRKGNYTITIQKEN